MGVFKNIKSGVQRVAAASSIYSDRLTESAFCGLYAARQEHVKELGLSDIKTYDSIMKTLYESKGLTYSSIEIADDKKSAETK